ncbi:MAG TPA: hypothetical protein VFS43_21670 [Polyangiaceae bacterium]|nr:hypothetical protein [Polyangiaceae bacterium]
MRPRLRGLASAAAIAAAGACSSGYFVDQAEVCRRAPNDPECPRAGSAGASGEGGGGGGPAGASGAGAGGSSGLGGGGSGGGGACASDAACAAGEGVGSLCVGGDCTAPSAGCSTATLVVVADGREPSGVPERACHFRALGPALAAIAGETKSVLVFADSAEAPAPVALGAGLALEGRAADPTKPVALEVAAPVAGAPLVTLADGSSLKGFALDGAGAAKGVAASSGSVTLAGPLTIKAATLALELTGEAKATVAGSAKAPVLLAGNARGVVVGPDAALTMTGAGEAGLVVEGTTAGAGVLVERGTGGLAATLLEGGTFRGNAASNGLTGTGAVEVRQSRQVVIKACAFEKNLVSLNLNGEGDSLADAFSGVSLQGNSFSAALTGSGGAVVCGASLKAGATKLEVDGANTFPGGKVCSTLGPATFGCTAGQLVGYTSPGNDVAVQCL